MDRRTKYVETLSARMVEWDNQIELLKEKAEGANPEVKLEYNNIISKLQFKRDEAGSRLQGISAASDEQWEELSAGTEQAWDEISNLLRDAIIKTK